MASTSFWRNLAAYDEAAQLSTLKHFNLYRIPQGIPQQSFLQEILVGFLQAQIPAPIMPLPETSETQ